MPTLILDDLPAELIDEIQDRAAELDVSPGEVVAGLVRIGLQHAPTKVTIGHGRTHSLIVLDTGEIVAPFNIPRPPGIPCGPVRVVTERKISPMVLWEDLEGGE